MGGGVSGRCEGKSVGRGRSQEEACLLVEVCVVVQVVSPLLSNSLLCFNSLILCLQRLRNLMIFLAA